MQTDYYYDYPNYGGKNPVQGYYFETYYIEYLLWALSEYLGETEVKRCSKCGYECKLGVAGEYFNRRNASKDGYVNVCKACKAEYDKQWYKANIETRLERSKQWYAANREARAKYLRANQETIAEYKKHYRKDNPDKYATYNHKHRTKKRNNGGSYTVAEEQLLLQWQGAKCVYCQCDISSGYERDHITPVSRGGNSYITNIALSCKSCNSSKGNKILWLWKSLDFALEFFDKRKQFNLLIALNKNN